MKLFTLFLVLVLLTSTGFAQQPLDLSECIAFAKQNNISLQRSDIDLKIADENIEQAKANRYPTLNGIATNNYNFGQRIDPFTNQFASTRVRSNSFSLNTDVDLFRGWQINNSIAQQKVELKISATRKEVLENDIALSIAAAYLQILLQEEIVSLLRNEFEQSKLQLNQTAILVQAGTLAEGERLNAVSQVARNEANLIAGENQLSINYLELRQLLAWPDNQDLELEYPEINIDKIPTPILDAELIYATSEKNLPDIALAEYVLQSAEKSLQIAKGSRSPVLRLGASYGTGYSGASREIIGTSFAGLTEIGETASGEDVFANQFSTNTQVIPFSKQLNNNVNQTIGVSLTLPILNNFSSQTAIHNAELRNKQASLDLEQAKLDLRNRIERARADAIAAKSNYYALEDTRFALEKSFEYSEERYKAGLLNGFDFNAEKNNLIRANSESLQAKYDFVFKMKILDFFLGKPISL